MTNILPKHPVYTYLKSHPDQCAVVADIGPYSIPGVFDKVTGNLIGFIPTHGNLVVYTAKEPYIHPSALNGGEWWKNV